MLKPSTACTGLGTLKISQGSTPILCWLSVADCKEPPELEHGFVTFSSRNNLTTYRAAIQYHCQHPYYHMAPNSTGEQGDLSPWCGWARGGSQGWPQWGFRAGESTRSSSPRKGSSRLPIPKTQQSQSPAESSGIMAELHAYPPAETPQGVFTKHHRSLHPLDMALGGSQGAHMSQPSFLLLSQYGKPKNFLTFLPPCS